MSTISVSPLARGAAPEPQSTFDPTALVAANGGPSCEERFKEWEGRLGTFFTRFEEGRAALIDHLRHSRSPNVPPSIRLDALSGALKRSIAMRQTIEAQTRAIDELLRTCGKELTDRQKQRLSDIRGQLSTENQRLRGLEFNVNAGAALIQAGRATDAVFSAIAQIAETIGSWIPPFPMRLPTLFRQH